MRPASGPRNGICRSGRSGWPARHARLSAFRFASSRRSIGGGSTFSPRAVRSISPGRAASSDMHRRSASPTASRARSPATAIMAGSKAQDDLFAAGKSSRQKYAELIVGRPGLGALLTYELVVTLAQARAGALGLALRKALYPSLLGACGRQVVFGQNVVLRHPHKIRIGSNVVIDDNCLLDAKGASNAGITIGDGVFIGRNTILSCKDGDIAIADGANLGFNCEVFSASRVTIGERVLIAAYVYVVGGDHDFSDPGKSVLEQAR